MLVDFIKKADQGCSYTSVPVVKLSTGTEVSLPVILLKGTQDGPTFYIGAAIHGNELNGIGVISKIIDSIKPTDLRGRLLFVPVQNPIAFQHKQHLIPRDVYKVSQPDPVIAFPGSATGDIAERIANAVLGLVTCADYAVDLHTGSPGYYYWPHSFCFSSSSETASKARELAKVFGTPIVTDVESGIWVAENVFYEAANKRGVPTFAVELGDGGCMDTDSIELGYKGICNVLRYLDILDGEISKNPDQVIVGTIVEVGASTGGILKHCVALGAKVKEGDKIAKVFDLHLREIESIKSPVKGIVYVQKTYPTVNGGEEVSVIGVPKDSS